MTAAPSPSASWAERVADRSEAVQRSRARQIEQAQAIVAAARRLIAERGDQFTTQELVKEARVSLQTFYRIFGGKDQLLLAVFHIFTHDALQVVHVVEINVIELLHVRVDVPWHGNVDNEQRAIHPFPQHRREYLSCQ